VGPLKIMRRFGRTVGIRQDGRDSQEGIDGEIIGAIKMPLQEDDLLRAEAEEQGRREITSPEGPGGEKKGKGETLFKDK